MPKRRRLLTTPMKKKSNQIKNDFTPDKDLLVTPEKEVSTARGRLKGALLEALEPTADDDSDTSYEPSPTKKERKNSKWNDDSEDEEHSRRRKSPVRQSYVLKLFDRSVDLSQFEEDSPLYPICRAWIANQPKANYSKFGRKGKDPEPTDDSIELPGPEGAPVSRIPELTAEQKATSIDKIKLDYEGNPPCREELLQELSVRWAGVRQAWLDQAARVEARYQGTQRVLNSINVNNA
ncbi:protein lin-37 homolog [Plodia interpunctella]|uniref:protein lin-37 homolog n=1 Tax=Plodia interpunctella TaxID=58824 RepID=UPI0023687354|nr:protein lin-37 homolog [Plodia interpunctella]